MNIQQFRKLSRPANSYFDSLLSIFDDYINEERSPGYGESDPSKYSTLLTCEKSGLELGLALAAGPLGNLAVEKADQPKELAWRVGKALPEERKPQDILEKLLGALVKRQSQELPSYELNQKRTFII